MTRIYREKSRMKLPRKTETRSMDWASILINALVTVMVGGLITLYISNSSKRIQYEYDYKTHLLQKRQKAYDDIEKLLEIYDRDLTKAKVQAGYYPDNRDTTMAMFNNYRACLKEIRKSTFWWSREMQQDVRAVGISILEIEEAEWPVQEEEAKFLGLVQYKFRPLHKALEKTYFKDIAGLNDIDSFKEAKKIDLEDTTDSIGVFDRE